MLRTKFLFLLNMRRINGGLERQPSGEITQILNTRRIINRLFFTCSLFFTSKINFLLTTSMSQHQIISLDNLLVWKFNITRHTERKYTFQDSLAPDDGKKKRTTSKNLEVSLNKIMKYEIWNITPPLITDMKYRALSIGFYFKTLQPFICSVQYLSKTRDFCHACLTLTVQHLYTTAYTQLLSCTRCCVTAHKMASNHFFTKVK